MPGSRPASPRRASGSAGSTNGAIWEQARPPSASVMSPGGSPRRYLLFRRPPPTPSPPSPAALCGEKERAPRPPPLSPPGGRASVNRQPRQRGCERRAGPALPHAGS
ncbi:proline-rich protein 18-like [Theropithecus gelada]|uniref:proline-rich protein 18-like n=1 Tax=Theropithecus gelada TaxID=9565 RepID=UPI000DC1B8DA|nr:proline-rich protein 18-like [Theropithecus gelada]